MLKDFESKHLVLATTLSLLSAWGCSDCSSGIAAGTIEAPTVDELPMVTNVAGLTVTGTRQADTTVWFHLAGASEAIKVAEATANTTWSHTMTLEEGINQFSVSASNDLETIFSDRAGPFSVSLDTTPPNPPVVDSYAGGIELSGAASRAITLTGTRDTDGDLGVDGTQVLTITGASTWSHAVTISNGVNTFVFTSTDAASNVSEAVTVVINGIGGVGTDGNPCESLDVPTVNALPELTNVPNQTLAGTKVENTYLKMVHAESGSTDVQTLVNLSAETAWESTVTLAEGTNRLHLYAENRTGCTSPVVMVSTTLDTIPPAAPLIEDLETPTIKAHSDVIGTRAADGNLCMRREQDPTCTEIHSQSEEETSFDLDITIYNNPPDGYNQLCFSSVDEAGNASEEICYDITKIAGPDVEFVTPTGGSVISTATLDVTALVVPGDEEGEEIASIVICLNADCTSDAVAESTPNRWTATFDTSGLSNGSIHLLSIEATNTTGAVSFESIQVIYQSGVFLISQTTVSGGSTDVVIAEAPDGVLHFVWSDECVRFGCTNIVPVGTSNPDDIFHRTFSATGWSDIHLISDGGGNQNNDGDSDTPSIAFDSNGQLHVVWSDENDGDFDIHHRIIPSGWDGTRTDLAAPTRLYNTTSNDSRPVLAAAKDGTIHLVWLRQAEESVQANRYAVLHATWSAEDTAWATDPTEVTTSETDINASALALDVDSDSLAHIAWHATDTDGDSWNVYYRYFTSSGLAAAPILVSNEEWEALSNAHSREPALVVDANDLVYIGWHGNVELYGSGTDYDVFIRTYLSGVAQQEKYQNFESQADRSAFNSEGVSLAILGNGDLFVSWLEKTSATSKTDVAYLTARYDTDNKLVLANGTGEIKIVAETAENALKVRTLIDRAGAIHVAWQDKTLLEGDETDSDDYDILYMAVPGD